MNDQPTDSQNRTNREPIASSPPSLPAPSLPTLSSRELSCLRPSSPEPSSLRLSLPGASSLRLSLPGASSPRALLASSPAWLAVLSSRQPYQREPESLARHPSCRLQQPLPPAPAQLPSPPGAGLPLPPPRPLVCVLVWQQRMVHHPERPQPLCRVRA